MKSTLTVRQAKSLVERARRLGRRTSDIVQKALDALLAGRSIGERAGHYRGRLKLSARTEANMMDIIRERNWRP